MDALIARTRAGKESDLVCEIHPAWDGKGSYVLRLWSGNAAGARRCRLLTNRDGRPVLFHDTFRAYRFARECGLPAERVAVRWPPQFWDAKPVPGAVTGNERQGPTTSVGP